MSPSSLAAHVACPNPCRRSGPWAVGQAPWHPERPSLAQGLSAQLGGWLCSEPRRGAGWPPFCPRSAELKGRASLSPGSHKTGDCSFPPSRDLIQHDKEVWPLWGKRLSLGANACVCQRVCVPTSGMMLQSEANTAHRGRHRGALPMGCWAGQGHFI